MDVTKSRENRERGQNGKRWGVGHLRLLTPQRSFSVLRHRVYKWAMIIVMYVVWEQVIIIMCVTKQNAFWSFFL